MRSTLAALLFSLLTIPALADEKMEAGTAVTDITPPKGYRMAGYFAERVNEGTHDPLLAKAMVFRQGDEQAALVFCDVVSIPRAVATRARAEVAKRTGIKIDHIAVAATHSHTGPLYHGVLRTKFHDEAVAAKGSDPAESVDYPALLVDRVAEAAAKAQKAVAPVELSAGSFPHSGLAFNRRFRMKDGTIRTNPGALNPNIVEPAGPIDPQVGVVFLRPEGSRRPTASLTVLALHLDTTGGTLYSADYPYYLQNHLRKAIGDGFTSIFGAGTCGNINHVDVTKRDRIKPEAIGTSLAQGVSQLAMTAEPVKQPGLAAAQATVELDLQRFTPEEVAEARKVLATFVQDKPPMLEVVRVCKIVDLADNYSGARESLDVQAFRLGADLAIVTLPGEIFVEHGLAIKRASPFKNTLVVELANGSPAYVPNRDAYDEGGYEVVNSRLAPGGGEKLVETAIGLLRSLATSGR